MKHLGYTASTYTVLTVQIDSQLDLDLTGTDARSLGHVLDTAGIKIIEFTVANREYVVEFACTVSSDPAKVRKVLRGCFERHYAYRRKSHRNERIDDIIRIGDPCPVLAAA